MSQDLYNDAILREAKGSASASPRLESPDLTVTLDNPLCGDRVTLDLRLGEGSRVVAAVGHKTRGCMLTQAAASVLARRAPGTTTDELRAVVRGLEASLRGAAEPEPTWPELEMFRPVHAIRSRHECVLLPFHALEDALAQAESPRAEKRP